jgi:hypothetical protein
MGFLVADGDKNLVLYMYQPESRESFGGSIVSCDVLFHDFCDLIFNTKLIKYESLHIENNIVSISNECT